MAVKLEVIPEGDTKLIIRHEPDFSTTKFVAGIFVLSVFLSLIGQSSPTESNWATFASIVAFVSFFAMALCVLDAIQLETIIDKVAKRVIHKRGGVLKSHVGAKETTSSFSEISFIEFKRHANRGIDLFQINLELKGNEKLYITAKNLGFGEAHQYAEQIHQFLGKEIPLKTVD